ncbi:MAG: phosphoribosylformylglycinamidine synthase I [Thermoproteota archaeon]|nr:phosphoribosylformylglycinamidine synthase I [Thermoproteota archaeon]
MRVKALVIRAEGTNCDLETVEALKVAGAEVTLAHINELLKKKVNLEDFQLCVIPGGFSYGDNISAGKILANIIKSYLKKDFKKFIDEEKPLIGICNGFQVLLKAGFLPFSSEGKQLASLTINDSGLFIDRWVYLRYVNKRKCVFTKYSNNVIYLPINHAEGKFVAEDKIIKKLFDEDQIVYQYSHPDGKVDEKANPNGSKYNIAAICNEYGNVLGIMPHPEKFIHKYMHPCWTRFPNLKEEGDGLFIFKNAVNYAKKFI